MKLIDIARNIDKSEKNESYVDLEVLQRELELPWRDDVEQNRLRAFWVDARYESGGWFGGRMYFFDGEPVAYSYSQGTGLDEEFMWFSRELAEKVRDFVQELTKRDLHVRVCDVNEDIGESYKIYDASEVLDWGKARYQGNPFEMIGVMPKTDWEIASGASGIDKVQIQPEGSDWIKVVQMDELDFLFHVNQGQEKLVDEVLTDATARCCLPHSVGKQVELERE